MFHPGCAAVCRATTCASVLAVRWSRLCAVTTSRASRVGGAVLWLGAALGFLVLEAIAAAAVVPSYSYDSYISALGVPAWSPLAAAMNAAFWIEGTLFLIGSLLVVRGSGSRLSWVFVFLVAADAVGNIAVAVDHGGSALATSGWWWLHGVGALVAMIGGNAAIVVGSLCIRKFVSGWWYRAVSFVLAFLGFVGITVLSGGLQTPGTAVAHPGAWERVTVYTILVWQIFTAVVLLLTDASGRTDGSG